MITVEEVFKEPIRTVLHNSNVSNKILIHESYLSADRKVKAMFVIEKNGKEVKTTINAVDAVKFYNELN